MVVQQGASWLIGLSLLAPGWFNGQADGSSAGLSLSLPQVRLFVRMRHYADFIRTTIEVRRQAQAPAAR